MKDNVLRAASVGIIATIIKDISDILYKSIGYQGFSIIEMSAGVFLEPEYFSSIYLYIIGYTAHYMVGIILGIIFYRFLFNYGYENSILKGIFFGLVSWLLLCGAFNHFGLSYVKPQNEQGVMMVLVDHIVFGIVLGLFMPRFTLHKK
ncbi:MAG: hypothetical protein APF84_03080 [Gracilibacter sp. BRH_c7a]|nr:MAG: hypothetical protein APF84_03080 [Gracilibacter sp. BRH_c7a]